MSDKWLTILAEFRYWRASAPVGLAMAFFASLAMLARWPAINAPTGVFSVQAMALVNSIPPVGLWVLLVVAVLLLGGWWCNVAVGVLMSLQRWVLGFLPLHRGCQDWSWLERAVNPIPEWELAEIQARMRKTTEYLDLELPDQPGAYRSFMREALVEPHSALGNDPAVNLEIIRSLTDTRMMAGLFPWLPLAIDATAIHVVGQYAELATLLHVGAWVVAVVLILGIGLQTRSSAGLVTREACTPSRLGRHARAAVGSGRRSAEVKAANDALG